MLECLEVVLLVLSELLGLINKVLLKPWVVILGLFIVLLIFLVAILIVFQHSHLN